MHQTLVLSNVEDADLGCVHRHVRHWNDHWGANCDWYCGRLGDVLSGQLLPCPSGVDLATVCDSLGSYQDRACRVEEVRIVEGHCTSRADTCRGNKVERKVHSLSIVLYGAGVVRDQPIVSEWWGGNAEPVCRESSCCICYDRCYQSHGVV